MADTLSHLDEFTDALQDYHVSESGKQILDQTKLVLLLAPSAGGRNTIIRELAKTGKYHFIVSDTTRAPRENDGILEQNGVHYWFRDEQEVLRDILDGNYLEAEVIHGQQVSGISIRELQKARDENKIAITDVDIGGVESIVKVKPDTISILVLPPSFAEWMKRLNGRGQIDKTELVRRLKTAKRIFESALDAQHLKFVVNDSIANAVQQINEIVIHGQDHKSHDTFIKLSQELLSETISSLQKSDSNSAL